MLNALKVNNYLIMASRRDSISSMTDLDEVLISCLSAVIFAAKDSVLYVSKLSYLCGDNYLVIRLKYIGLIYLFSFL